jgi:hypothetical protein
MRASVLDRLAIAALALEVGSAVPFLPLPAGLGLARLAPAPRAAVALVDTEGIQRLELPAAGAGLDTLGTLVGVAGVDAMGLGSRHAGAAMLR